MRSVLLLCMDGGVLEDERQRQRVKGSEGRKEEKEKESTSQRDLYDGKVYGVVEEREG